MCRSIESTRRDEVRLGEIGVPRPSCTVTCHGSWIVSFRCSVKHHCGTHGQCIGRRRVHPPKHRVNFQNCLTLRPAKHQVQTLLPSPWPERNITQRSTSSQARARQCGQRRPDFRPDWGLKCIPCLGQRQSRDRCCHGWCRFSQQ